MKASDNNSKLLLIFNAQGIVQLFVQVLQALLVLATGLAWWQGRAPIYLYSQQQGKTIPSFQGLLK